MNLPYDFQTSQQPCELDVIITPISCVTNVIEDSRLFGDINMSLIFLKMPSFSLWRGASPDFFPIL